jgi:RNA recognition motif-containing protein
MEIKLYVGNLSYETTEDELRSLFTQTGTVNDVALIKDRDTGSSKGFAFVTMNSQEEANQAIQQLNGRILSSRELKVNLARPRESNYDSNQGSGNQSNSSRNRSGGRQRF